MSSTSLIRYCPVANFSKENRMWSAISGSGITLHRRPRDGPRM
ncbi:MAG TPA: hypothetical protein PK955_02165 [Methanoregulaceae archaeon]|nr:hypothetical protein [Methanoregulaceae archaeon]